MDGAIRFGPPLERVQLAAAVGAILVVTAFSWASGQWWRTGAALACSLPLLWIARQWIAREQTTPSRPLVGFFGSVFAAQTLIVALTGGIQSPVLVVWGGMGWIAGYAIGRFRPTANVLVIPISATILWALWPRAQALMALPESRAIHGRRNGDSRGG